MTSSIPPSGTRLTSTIARHARTVVMLVLGVLIDACAVMNVPGAAVLTDAVERPVEVTDIGTGLVLLVIVAWIAVIWRVKHPLIALAAGGALALIGISYVLLLVGAIAAARRYPARVRAIGFLSVTFVMLFVLREALTSWGAALPWLLNRDAEHQNPAWIVVSCVIAAISIAVAAAVVFASLARTQAVQSKVRADHEQQRAEILSEQMVRQKERERIARDVHDALAHRLSVVSLHAGALEGASDGMSGEIARTVREQTHAALQDMRGLIGDLRSEPAISTPSTLRALGPLLNELRRSGVQVTAFVLIEGGERASAQLDSAVHRIVQESLTNAIKHAPAAPIDVFVQVEPHTGARIRVVNRMRAENESIVPGGHHGILGIRERAASLDGTAWIGPHEGSFIVDVTLPWQERGDPPLSSTGDHR